MKENITAGQDILMSVVLKDHELETAYNTTWMQATRLLLLASVELDFGELFSVNFSSYRHY